MVIYPGSDFEENVRKELKNKNVIVLDYSNLFSASDPRYVLAPEDKHPSALAIQTLADRLVKDLALQ